MTKQLDEEPYRKVQDLLEEAADIIKIAWNQTTYHDVKEMIQEILGATI